MSTPGELRGRSRGYRPQVVHVTLLYDIRAPEHGVPPAELYRAAAEQCAWADSRGLTSVTLTEHHATDDGYLPSPAVLGAAVAGVTRHIQLRLAAVLLPLYHPLRLAEDLALVDLISGGRLRLTVGLGYRAVEYEQLGIEWRDRVALMEEGIETLKRAWTGEPFEYRGRTVRVLPRPAQRPRPAIFMGGTSPASARRAARIADGYQPAVPALYDLYLEELAAVGKSPPDPEEAGLATIGPYLFLSEDPERDWERIAPFALYDNNEYAKWVAEIGGGLEPIDNPTELRRHGTYRVITPEECLELAGSSGMLVLKTLMGGMNPDIGWESLRLFADKVWPKLAAVEAGPISTRRGGGEPAA
jgi:alkanesulfonate monooxygenase SsuD/methylene tetrahydromethanopterin reductase-like flavin-dependent oxidoreductase (luciferase family)